MRPIAAAAMLLALAAVPASAQVSLDFESGAPCGFNGNWLTTQYSGAGVTFNGNGQVLDQCGTWPTGNAHSGVDFIAYNNGAGRPASESMVFSSAQSFFDIFVGSTVMADFDFYLGGNLVGSTGNTAFDPNSWTEVSQTLAYDRVDVNALDGFMQLDDLNTQQSAAPEPASLVLLGTGLLGIGAVVRRRRAD